MPPDRSDDPSSLRPRSRQPSATRINVKRQEKFSSHGSDLVRHVERRSGRAHGDGVRISNERNLSSDESEEDNTRRLGRAKRVNTLSKDYTEDEETAIIKKFDRKLVLFLAFLYLLSFLDRSSTHTSYCLKARSDRYRHWQRENCWPRESATVVRHPV